MYDQPLIVEFDPAEDAANLVKHGVSLARAVDLEVVAVITDDRFSEPRIRLYDTVDGVSCCLAAAFAAKSFAPSRSGAPIGRNIVAMSFKHPPEPADGAPFDDPDNPEWTEADFARAKPLSAFPELAAAFARKPGRPLGSKTSDRQQVTLRLPRSVIDYFKAGGPGWQTRAVEVLKRAAGEG